VRPGNRTIARERVTLNRGPMYPRIARGQTRSDSAGPITISDYFCLPTARPASSFPYAPIELRNLVCVTCNELGVICACKPNSHASYWLELDPSRVHAWS